jgi:hypothetical protein
MPVIFNKSQTEPIPVPKPPVTPTSSPKKRGPWLEHVHNWRKKNPGVSYKDSLKQAKETYVLKPKREKKDRSEYKPNPWMQYIKKYKDDHPDWKQRMSYKELLIACKETYNKKE